MKYNYLLPVITLGFALTGLSLPATAESINQPITATNSRYAGESQYNTNMRLGYAAMQRQDYQSAAQYFRAALFYNYRDRNATIAYWNARSKINDGKDNTKTAYDRHMKIGYRATDRENYQTALINFRRALQERPQDYYASQAILNVRTYINRGQKPTSPNDVSTFPQFNSGETFYNRYMRLGYAAQQRKDYTDAIKYFGNALSVNPNDREATIAYWNVKDIIDSDQNPEAQKQNKYERQMQLGYNAVEADNYKQALTHFQAALQQRPQDYYAQQAVRNIRTYIVRGR